MRKRLFHSLSTGLWMLVAFASQVLVAQMDFAVIGDAGALTSGSKTVRESIHRKSVQWLILPGDNLYEGTYAKIWNPWTSLGMTFAAVALGNHKQSYAEERAFFSLPEEFYEKKMGAAQFIVLNSDNTHRSAEQSAWLEGVLAATESPYVFLVYHHPSYTVSSFHTWEEKRAFQLTIRPLLLKYRSKITALLVGHDHLATLLHFDDLPVVLSGAVQDVRLDKGVDYVDTTNPQHPIHVKTAWYYDHKAYWAQLSIPQPGQDPEGSVASVHFTRAADDFRSCSATLRTGKRLELAPNCLTAPPRLPQ